MSIEQEARARAEKRYRPLRTPGGYCEPQWVALDAFTAGYIAGASRPVTDEEVEAACDGFYTHGIATWSGLVKGDPELADRYREWMRDALEAARALADKEQGNGHHV